MPKTFEYLIYTWIGIAIITFFSLFFLSAPYGRHKRKGWGKTIDNRLGWILMEIVSPLTFAYFFLNGSSEKLMIMWIFLSCWVFHYTNRSLVFPLRLKTKGKKMPLMIMFSAIFFNAMNGYINGYYLGNMGVYTNSWIYDWRFVLGTSLFTIGWIINVWSDEILLHLRKPHEKGYKIPKGGFYRYISCPNYFGEMIEWLGFAIMTWNLASLSFALWTIANLAPRAFSNHKWYKNKFPNYPKNRKALVPFIL